MVPKSPGILNSTLATIIKVNKADFQFFRGCT